MRRAQPARTLRVGALFGRRKAFPWKRTDTLSLPRLLRLLNLTRLRYVQSGRGATLLKESVLARFLKRTFTVPLHRRAIAERAQYPGFVTPGGQMGGTQLVPTGGTMPAQNGGGTTRPLVVNV